jgi:hypothetical protein
MVEAYESLVNRTIQVNVRPEHLRNPAPRRCLEYDGYDSTLRIGLDYNGPQHYVYPNRYHHDESAFAKQLERDKLKHELSARANVRLIIVPYTVDCPLPNVYPPHSVRRQRLSDYLRQVVASSLDAQGQHASSQLP